MGYCEIWLPEISDWGKITVWLSIIIFLLRPIYINIGIDDPLYTCIIGSIVGIILYVFGRLIETYEPKTSQSNDNAKSGGEE
jgi:hypothetical protein